MPARKTYPVADLVDLANEMIALADDAEARKALCVLVESVLGKTGNYHGFGFNYPLEVVQEPTFDSSDEIRYYNRHYFYA